MDVMMCKENKGGWISDLGIDSPIFVPKSG